MPGRTEHLPHRSPGNTDGSRAVSVGAELDDRRARPQRPGLTSAATILPSCTVSVPV
jgi:hypothetical protein